MFFNHHKALKDIGIVIKDDIVPKSQKDFRHTIWRIKRYFSKKRISEAKGLFDIIFDIEWQDYKDNVEQHYQRDYGKEVEDYYNIHNSKFNLYRTLIYIKDDIRDYFKYKWKTYKNYWQYGFWDSEETYGLDYVSTVYLYERVKRYKELASEWIYLYPDKEHETESLHQIRGIPVVTLKDIDSIKELYNKNHIDFYNNENSIVKVEYKDLYQYECIDLILEYLEKVLRSNAGQYIFDYNYNGIEIDIMVEDTDEHGDPFYTYNKEMDAKYPDHMFYHCLEERYADILNSYAFIIYGKIIRLMWW